MTPEEFKNKMLELYPYPYVDDPEGSHWEADKLIISLLKELGYEEGAEIFQNGEKWYS